jgi:hypothetical protein
MASSTKQAQAEQEVARRMPRAQAVWRKLRRFRARCRALGKLAQEQVMLVEADLV